MPFIRGGAEILIEDLIYNLDREGFSVEKIALPFKWYPHDEILKNALAWRLLDLSESNGQKIDLVIGTKFPSYVVGHDNKVVWLVHQHRAAYDLFGTEYSNLNGSEDSIKVREQIVKIDINTLSESKAIYTISKNVANRLKKFNGLDGVCLYPPPRNHKLYRSDSYGDYILSVGRLDKLKRVDLLIKSLKYTDESIKCVIVGKGSEEEYLKKLALNLGLEKRIKFTGFVSEEDLINLYANCFAVYYSPNDEDYGYVTVESLLSKKPVITTNDSGGVLEFVTEGSGGEICNKDPENIGQCINRFFNNKDFCKSLGNEGYKIVKDISWNNVIDALTSTL